jgi:hypothetical protein
MAQVAMVAWGGMAAVCLPMFIIAAVGFGLDAIAHERVTLPSRGAGYHTSTGVVAIIYGIVIAGGALVLSLFFISMLVAAAMWVSGRRSAASSGPHPRPAGMEPPDTGTSPAP